MNRVRRFSTLWECIWLIGLLMILMIVFYTTTSATVNRQEPGPVEPKGPQQQSNVNENPEHALISQVSNHQIEAGHTTLRILWQTSTPQIGWVLYGSNPDQIVTPARNEQAPDELRTEHIVEITNLSPNSLIYYVIMSGGDQIDKNGMPFYAVTNSTPKDLNLSARSSTPQRHFSEELEISFEYFDTWNVIEFYDGPDDENSLELSNSQLGHIVITRDPNPLALSLEQWYQEHRSDYHPELTTLLSRTEIGTHAALFIGQPNSCETYPMIAAFVEHSGFMYTITYFELAGRNVAPELGTLLATLSFGSESTSTHVIEESTISFPFAIDVPCVTSRSVDPNARRCPGAAMYLPSEGTMRVPWNCFNNDRYCFPYRNTDPNEEDEYKKKPHRGIDIFGTAGTTPVYATYSGLAYRVNTSNIRLVFDGEYTGKSAWLAHMASADGLTDYRQITNGARVLAGQFIGYQGNFNVGGAGTHLHISYVDNSSGTETWPTLDPTKFLSTKHMVWYKDWNSQCSNPACAQTSVTCSVASFNDSFEPDNFANLARVISVNSSPQKHDFHAPGDEDWVKFTAASGVQYTIETLNLGSQNDTYLFLYSTDGRTLLASNDDADGVASRIRWTAPTNGTYYIKVRHYSFIGYEPYNPEATYLVSSYTKPVYGANTHYDLRVTSGNTGVTCNSSQYRAEYFNNRALSGSPAFVRCESSINYDWGGGGPGNGVGNDNFSVRWTGNMNFNAGNYTFIARADDGIRVWVNNSSVIDAWRDQGPTEYRGTRSLSAGTHSIKVEYYENGGGAVAQFRWEQAAVTCNSSQYRAEYFNNRTLSGNPTFVRCEGWPINFDWGSGGPGNGIGNDNFSVRWTGTANFNAGNYKFIARADDGINVWFDGTQIINGWRDQAPTEYSNTRSVSSGNHTIKVEYYENGGGAVAQFRWDQAATSSSNLAKDKPAYAYTSESSNYTPGKATDGSTSTRWSSGHRTSLPQWWWVDLGSRHTFDRVVIRWEAAYATRYFVGWSDDGTNYTGYNYSRSSAGTYTHDIGTRTARYIGIKMDARASGMNNFSFWEVEVYRTSRSALSPAELDIIEVVFADDAVEGELVEPDGDLVTMERLLEPALQPETYEIYLPSTSR
ncbi:MAG: discoidin domain-containing protein [Caldilineaceae bacterium]|nr:discoidin domain-containing protein [Caldilineaceae bacterium]